MNLRPSVRNWMRFAGSFAACMGIAALAAQAVRPAPALLYLEARPE